MDALEIDPNYGAHARDIDRLVRAIKILRNLIKQPALKCLQSVRVDTRCQCANRFRSRTLGSPNGRNCLPTCGHMQDGCRRHGGGRFAIAEKAADMVLEEQTGSLPKLLSLSTTPKSLPRQLPSAR